MVADTWANAPAVILRMSSLIAIRNLLHCECFIPIYYQHRPLVA